MYTAATNLSIKQYNTMICSKSSIHRFLQSLWTTINQFRQQIGWTSETVIEGAQRVVDLGRQQQEARSWIANWRGRMGQLSTLPIQSDKTTTASPAAIAAAQRAQDETDLQRVQAMSRMLQESVAGREDYTTLPAEQQQAVHAVLAALERAQRAAEEAAASSSALELAIEQAEYAGALSSSDEEDQVLEEYFGDVNGETTGGTSGEEEAAPALAEAAEQSVVQ